MKSAPSKGSCKSYRVPGQNWHSSNEINCWHSCAVSGLFQSNWA